MKKPGHEKLLEAYHELVAASHDAVDCWEWWQMDTYDRCASVPSDAIHELKITLDAQKSLLSEGT